MALGLWGEVIDQKGDDDRADYRSQDNGRTPSTRRREHIRIVSNDEAAVEEEIVKQTDQITENYRTETGHYSESECQN